MSKMESKKLQTRLHEDGSLIYDFGYEPLMDARIAQELMDPARKTPETPLEREQREVIKQLVRSLQLCQPSHPYKKGGTTLRGQALTAAAPFLEN